MWRMRRTGNVGTGNTTFCVLATFSVPRSPESATSHVSDLGNLVPRHPWRRQHNGLGEAVAAAHHDIRICHVQDLYHHLVIWPGIVGIDDPDAVGHGQSPLERGAASGENGKKVTGWHL